MNPKPNTLLLLAFLAGVMLISGCTGLDPETLAKSNAMIQQFLKDHPNAQIKVTHFTAEQAKNIIDQIRKDCENPYIDEKEFYKVTINDTETNFFAVAWIDWETKVIECAYKLGSEGVAIDKPKQANCTAHAYSKCYKSHIYWIDSCGNIQDKKEYCQYGCSGEKCLGECKSQAEYRCYGDYVFWFDSCGNKQEKKEYCQFGCENGFCKTQRPEKTCEDAGGYCIWPKGYCGDGVCSESESGVCPQDCEVVPPSVSGGKSQSEGQAICENKCAASPDIKFADFWADKEVYYVGEVINFFAKLVDANGNPATPEQGNKVYFFAVSPTAPTGSSAPISYNNTTGYYEFSAPPIPNNVELGTWIFFATAEKGESFAASENIYVTLKSTTAQTALPSASPAPYEGCINKCLLRFRAAEFTAIATPKISIVQSAAGGEAMPAPASTGMVLAVETTAVSTTVAYQCREGYEASPNYFCKEGGVCCIPKTIPIEFCGSSTQGACYSDAECIKGGCSGQICQSIKEEPATTTCEYKECYNAEKFGMRCRCLNERCQWAKPAVCPEDAKVCPDGKNVYRNPKNNCEFDPCPSAQTWYRNSYWQCYDGKESYEGGETSCKSYETWRKYAEDFCSGHCNTATATSENIIKCGVNTFRVWNDCSQETTCTDSDGGLNYYQLGTATSGSQSLSDHCNDDFTLTEKFCSGSEIKWETYQCPVGCRDGACLQEQQAQNCTETDGGRYDYYTKGTITTQQGSSADFCVSPTMLVENYCDYSYYPPYQGRSDSYTCPNGCQDGACLEQAQCTNECSYEGQTQCTSTEHIKKCSSSFDNDPCLEWGDSTYCGSGYACSNNTCIQQPAANCTSYYDQVCPASCSAGSDADCCASAGKYWLQTNSGYGCYDSNYNPGCSAGKPCSDASDQCCPNWCAAGSDMDCCLQAGKNWTQSGCY